MTAEEFRTNQMKLSMTNQQLADKLGVTKRSVDFWRAGTVKVTGPVALAVSLLISEGERKGFILHCNDCPYDRSQP